MKSNKKKLDDYIKSFDAVYLDKDFNIIDKPEPKLTNTEIYKQAIDKFGINNQLLKAIEELAELQIEISKASNEHDFRKGDLIGEIADVEIMIEQLKLIFDCHDIIKTVKQQKIERLKGLLSD